MANNYVQFSAVLPMLTPEEEAWLEHQLEVIYVFGEREVPEAELPKGTDPVTAAWSGCRFHRDSDMSEMVHDEGWNEPGFQYSFQTDEGSWGRHLWLYSEEHGSPDSVAILVKEFLKQFRPDNCWGFTYAATCSKLRVDEFSGGGIFVTADDIRFWDALDFLDDALTAFKAKKEPK